MRPSQRMAQTLARPRKGGSREHYTRWDSLEMWWVPLLRNNREELQALQDRFCPTGATGGYSLGAVKDARDDKCRAVDAAAIESLRRIGR